VAHEVRNPLASIKLRLDLIGSKTPLPDGAAQAIAAVSQEITRLDRLVADLLVVAGRRTGPHRRISLGELVRTRAAGLGDWAAGREVSIATAGDGEAGVDPDAIARAIDNLLRNAVEASPHGAQVVARVAPQGAGVCVRVEDSGIGVEPSRVSELFEPFFTTKADGTGLGLAISRAIARAHGGDLTYAREEGTTAFQLVLPDDVQPAGQGRVAA
jgi:signal transduction histidine kinase